MFKLCTVKPLVTYGSTLFKVGQAVSPALTAMLMKQSFFSQFIAGEDAQSIQPTIQSLNRRHIGAILDYAAEADVEPSRSGHASSSAADAPPTAAAANSKPAAVASSSGSGGPLAKSAGPNLSARSYSSSLPPSAAGGGVVGDAGATVPAGEAKLDANLTVSLSSIHTATGYGGFSAVKVSGLAEPQLLVEVSDVIEAHRFAWAALMGAGRGGYWAMVDAGLDSATKAFTDRGAFVAAATAGGKMAAPAAERLHELVVSSANSNSSSSNNSSVITFSSWTSALLRLSATGSAAQQQEVAALLAPLLTSSYAPGPLSVLSPPQQAAWARVTSRCDALADTAARCGVTVLIDAEQTYLQPAIDALTFALQTRYNAHVPASSRPPVYGTYQAYLKDARWRLAADMAGVSAIAAVTSPSPSSGTSDVSVAGGGPVFGAKLVRGAYLGVERSRAAVRGQPDPTQPSLAATHASYDACAALLMTGIRGGTASAMFATHNEASVTSLAGAVTSGGLPPAYRHRASFAQLLGMCDHLTEALAQAGVPVAKYVPYGPVAEVVPYLLRRAQENSDLLGGSSGGGVARELALLRQELGRRVRAALRLQQKTQQLQ